MSSSGIWFANVATTLGAIVVIVGIVNRYIIKPVRKQFRESVREIVHELQTANGTTLGQTVENMAHALDGVTREISELRKTTTENVEKITSIERTLK